MSGERYIKQALIASLCEHPEQEKYRQRAFSGENLEKVMEALSSQQHSLTKNDFLTPDDQGRYIIDCPGFWRHFDKINALLAKRGERFDFDDFTQTIRNTGDEPYTLLDSARENSGLSKLFTVSMWRGRFDEMERLWYRVPMTARTALSQSDGRLPLSLKRALFAAEGRALPEDGLARAHLGLPDIRSAFQSRAGFDRVTRQLQQNGDYLRKEYTLLLDGSGDTVFDQKPSWDFYAEAVGIMKKNGERFEVADFIRQAGYAQNILTRAAENNALLKIFDSAHWVDRLQDMLDLWSCVRVGWRATSSIPLREFDRLYAEAEAKTYDGLFYVENLVEKADILRPVNGAAAASGAEKPVLPIGMKAYWDNYDTLRATPAGQVTLADLRERSGQMQNTCLIQAAKYGRFAAVAGIARASGARLTAEDFLSKDYHGTTLLQILAERQQLALVFSAEMWVGAVPEMKALWAHVRSDDRKQVNIAQVEVAAEQATLRQGARPRLRLKKPGEPD